MLVFQFPDPANAVQQVPGETAHRFCDDHVDLPSHGVLHHELEGRPVIGIGAGKPVIHVCANILPLGIGPDHISVIRLLQLDGESLVDVVRGNPAVGGHSENPVILLRCGCRGNLVYAVTRQRVDLLFAGFLRPGPLRHERAFLRPLGLLNPPSGAFFGHGPYVFQCASLPHAFSTPQTGGTPFKLLF